MKNKPFVFGVPTSGDNFAGREKETSLLLESFANGVNTVLISPRRWGKTSLVKKVCQQGQTGKLKMVCLDTFSCRTDKEFYGALASAVLRQTASSFEELMENARLFLSDTRVKFTIGSDPLNDFSISVDLNPKDNDYNGILQLPEKIAQKKDVRIIICIDDFQQIAEYKDSKTFQKRLRTAWQLQPSVSYCLIGSRKEVMNELFEKRGFPFFKFGDVIYLPIIATDEWATYICKRFIVTGKQVSRELAGKVCGAVDHHSSYVQQLAWLLWAHTRQEATEQDLIDAYQDLIDHNTPLFEKQTENLSTYQLNFLRAIVDGVHSEFTTQDVLQKYQLGSSANVSIVRQALLKKGLVEIVDKQVHLADPVMKVWLKQAFCPSNGVKGINK